MSAIKPVIRELREAVLNGMAHGKDRLHQLTDNMNDHLDDIVRQVRDQDTFDAPPALTGNSTDRVDRSTTELLYRSDNRPRARSSSTVSRSATTPTTTWRPSSARTARPTSSARHATRTSTGAGARHTATPLMLRAGSTSTPRCRTVRTRRTCRIRSRRSPSRAEYPPTTSSALTPSCPAETWVDGSRIRTTVVLRDRFAR